MPAPTWTTEVDYCPLTGDRPPVRATRSPAFAPPAPGLMPGLHLPAETADGDAERKAKQYGAVAWTRDEGGRVILWMAL